MGQPYWAFPPIRVPWLDYVETRTSLFRHNFSNEEKKFYNIYTCSRVNGHFTHVGYSRNIIKQHLQCQLAEVNFGTVQ